MLSFFSTFVGCGIDRSWVIMFRINELMDLFALPLIHCVLISVFFHSVIFFISIITVYIIV